MINDAVKIPARAKSPKNLIKIGPNKTINPLEKLIKLVGITNNIRVFVSGREADFWENLFLCFDVMKAIKKREEIGASKIHNPARKISVLMK